eukprot:80463_1
MIRYIKRYIALSLFGFISLNYWFISNNDPIINSIVDLSISNDTYDNKKNACNNPTHIMWHFINDFGQMYHKILMKSNFNKTCSYTEIPTQFRGYNDQNGTHSFFCLKYNINNVHNHDKFCSGGRIFYISNLSIAHKYQLRTIGNKAKLNIILTEYCNQHKNVDCNFRILSYNMDNNEQRIEFLSKHINCTNDKPQHNKTWVFKENKDNADGVHFYNNHQLIYKLIAPSNTEQQTYYKHCSNINPFPTRKYLRKEKFTFKKIKSPKGFRVSYDNLLMQQFISDPLLIEDSVFHIRQFLLLASYSKP